MGPIIFDLRLQEIQVKMKIIHIHPDSRMANLFVRPLIEEERRCGFCSFGVCALGEADEFFEVYSGACLRSGSNLALVKDLPRFWRFMNKESPDIVVCHNSISALLPLVLGLFLGIKTRIYFNHGVPFLGYRGVKRLVLWVLEYCNLKVANHVISVSEAMKNALLGVARRDAVSVSLLGPGSCCGLAFEYNVTETEAEANKLRDNLNIERADVVFLFVGRPETRKGFDFCLRLWSQNRFGDRAKLVLCGPSLKDVLERYGTCPKNVLPVGFQSQMNPWYCLASCIILPSYHEGLSYAVLEGLSFGKPAIVNQIPGVTELIPNDSVGWVLNYDDMNGYASIIASIIKDVSIAEIKSAACIKQAKRFSRDRIVRVYINTLEGFINQT